MQLLCLLALVGLIRNIAALPAVNVSLGLSPSPRITNGVAAYAGQFPYQVGLSIRLSGDMTSWCGGSLIDQKWVLTAAHCMERALAAVAYFGATARRTYESRRYIMRSNIFVHPNWNRKQYDICLLRIANVRLSDNIQPIALPSESQSAANYVGQHAIASGWGKTSDDNDALAPSLQYARLLVIPGAICRRGYGSSMFSGSNICVRTPNGASTCSGDSGGPLVLESSGVLIGITSYGTDAGCENEYPAVFTRVASYLDWIESHTGIAY